MATGCGDVLSLEDLKTARLHQLFEAEVITGLQGGVAGGNEIDFATNQVTGQSQKTLPAVLRDAGFQPASFTFASGGVLSSADRNKAVYDVASKAWYLWQGELPKTIAAGSSPLGDINWKPWTDPDLRTALASPSGEPLVNIAQVTALPSGNLSQVFPYVTPEQFVLPGETFKDGVNDDAVQINRALDYVESVGGGVVWLSKGNYYQNTQILVPGGCTLRGCGMFSTTINAMPGMDKRFNCITSKNNLMYLWGAGADHPDYTDYTYISGVVIEDLGVNGNHAARYPVQSGLGTSVQACGIKLTSVKHSRISRVFVTHAILHAFDVSAMTFFDDGNYTHQIAGGSEYVLIEGCFGMNSLLDDIFTCHNSRYITYRKCHAYNDGTDANMQWNNGQHGFEIDEGNRYILVEDCVADYLMAGFQCKGHDTTLPAQEVVFRRCHAKNCAWSFQVEHLPASAATLGVYARGVIIENCISENAYNDRYAVANTIYRARAMWLRGYVGIKIKDFTVIRGNGVIEMDREVTSVTIDGLLWKEGYYGANASSTNVGYINVVSGQTRGHHVFKNIVVTDPANVPIIRCVDTDLTQGITVQDVSAVGAGGSYPCLFMTLNTPSNISGIAATGFNAKIQDTSLGALYPIDVDLSVEAGCVKMRTPDVPSPATHPPRVGNTAISKKTGKMYTAVGSTENTNGTWTLVGLQT